MPYRYKHIEDVVLAMIGAVSPFVGKLIGWLELGDMMKTAILSAVGASTAYLVKKTFDCVFEWIDRKRKRK